MSEDVMIRVIRLGLKMVIVHNGNHPIEERASIQDEVLHNYEEWLSMVLFC
jgi:hypothetical protein